MQNVLGRYRLLADAALGEGDILRDTTVEVMGDHDHIEGLFESIHCVRSRRTCRRWDDIRLTAHFYDVRGVPATGSFRVKRVNRSSFEGCDCVFDKTALVQRIGVDKNLHIHVICYREAAIDRGGRRTPVFMKLQAARPGLNLLNETGREACVAFAEKAEIHGKGIGSLDHPPNKPGSWRAGGLTRYLRRPLPT